MPNNNKIGVLIIDKSVVDREILSKSLDGLRDIEVLATAP